MLPERAKGKNRRMVDHEEFFLQGGEEPARPRDTKQT